MIKVFPQVAKHILLHLVYLRDLMDQEGLHRASQQEYLSDHWTEYNPSTPYHTQELVGEVREVVRREGVRSISPVIEDLCESALRSTSSTGGGDLMDEVVKILKLPYGQNVVSGKMMEALRKAILIPEEIAAFSQKVKANELPCVGCGHEFHHQEVATISRVGGTATIYCLSCLEPEYVSCRTCAGSHEHLPKGFAKMMHNRHQCQTCKEGGGAGAVVEPVLRDPGEEFDGGGTRMRGGEVGRRMDREANQYRVMFDGETTARSSAEPYPTAMPTPPPHTLNRSRWEEAFLGAQVGTMEAVARDIQATEEMLLTPSTTFQYLPTVDGMNPPAAAATTPLIDMEAFRRVMWGTGAGAGVQLTTGETLTTLPVSVVDNDLALDSDYGDDDGDIFDEEREPF